MIAELLNYQVCRLRHSGVFLSHFWVRSHTKFKHLIFSKDRLPYNYEDVTDLAYYQKG